MEPLYEGNIEKKRLCLPSRLDDVLYALRLDKDVVATFRKTPVHLLALRHPDVFLAECEYFKDSDPDDVFGDRWICAETEVVQRDICKRLVFRESSLRDLCVGDKSPVCLDVLGEELIVVKKEDWPKYVAWRLINSKQF